VFYYDITMMLYAFAQGRSQGVGPGGPASQSKCCVIFLD